MIPVATVYLVLSFPGQPHALAVLPMESTAVCWREAKELEVHYESLSGSTKVFAHCVRNYETLEPNERR